MTGTVNSKLEATLSVAVHGPAGKQAVTAVIDTGYTGSLSLPLSVVAALSLPATAKRKVRLADGTIRHLDYYEAEVEWNGQRREIAVVCVEGDALLGTHLLNGFKMDADFVAGGAVRIVAL